MGSVGGGEQDERGAGGEELGARGGCQGSEKRLGLELAVETRVCFPQLPPPNALFSALFL